MRLEDSVTPDFYAKVSRDFMQSSANEVSISRLKSAYKWGLPVPLDSEHVIHVWFEALLSYFTAARQLASGQNSESFEVLPPNLQIIGKDILNFHTLTFPGMCFALGLQPSSKTLCHSHWTVNGEKMSKRSGNSIDPMPLIVKYSADALRYYMFKDGRLMSDADFSISRLQALYKDDLIDKIGNLFTRILNPKLLSHVPAEFCFQTKNSSLTEAKHKFLHAIDRHYENFEFNRAVDCVLEFVKQINAHINHSQIWTFTHKHAAKSNFLNDFGEIYDLLKVLCICLLPILPSKAAAVLKLLGVSVRDQTFQQLLDQNVARTIRLDASDALCASVRFEKTQ